MERNEVKYYDKNTETATFFPTLKSNSASTKRFYYEMSLISESPPPFIRGGKQKLPFYKRGKVEVILSKGRIQSRRRASPFPLPFLSGEGNQICSVKQMTNSRIVKSSPWVIAMGLSENSNFFKIEAYEKNYRRHIVDIPGIIF